MNIEPMLRQIFAVLPQAGVLVIDDNSPDGTAAIVKRVMSEFPNLNLLLRPRREGLGKAYLDAMARSLDAADLLITMDADFSHDPSYLPLLAQAAASHDLVIGSRYVRTGAVAQWESWRRALSAGGNCYGRMITGLPVHDLTSGFQAVRTTALRSLQLDRIAASGYAFLIELKYRLWRHGANLTEIPITFHARRGGESKLSSHIVWEGVTTPWRLRLGRLGN